MTPHSIIGREFDNILYINPSFQFNFNSATNDIEECDLINVCSRPKNQLCIIDLGGKKEEASRKQNRDRVDILSTLIEKECILPQRISSTEVLQYLHSEPLKESTFSVRPFNQGDVNFLINSFKEAHEKLSSLPDNILRSGYLPRLEMKPIDLTFNDYKELPSILCQMSSKGDLEKIKQIFAYVNQEKISVEEMGVKNNEVHYGKKPTLVDTNSGSNGGSPLMEAAEKGHSKVCNYLISEKKANLEARNDYQNTALTLAAWKNNTEVINLLLQHNADVRAKGKGGYHAAYIAAEKGNLEALQMLVEKDGDVVDLKGWNGETPLMVASMEGMVEVCRYLVEEKNANINLKDNSGKTALERAEIYKRNHQIIEILTKAQNN